MDADLEIFTRKEDLHPDLVPYVDRHRDIPVLYHPLCYVLFYTEQMNAYCNRIYLTKQEALLKCLETRKWGRYVFLHERPWRLWAFQHIEEDANDQEYWTLLADIWTDSENIWQNHQAWRDLLESPRADRELFMTPKEQHVLRTLPERFRVYRGCSDRSRDGMSWTRDRKVAEFFARRHRQGYVIQKTVQRTNVFAYTDRRSEKELIIL